MADSEEIDYARLVVSTYTTLGGTLGEDMVIRMYHPEGKDSFKTSGCIVVDRSIDSETYARVCFLLPNQKLNLRQPKQRTQVYRVVAGIINTTSFTGKQVEHTDPLVVKKPQDNIQYSSGTKYVLSAGDNGAVCVGVFHLSDRTHSDKNVTLLHCDSSTGMYPEDVVKENFPCTNISRAETLRDSVLAAQEESLRFNTGDVMCVLL
jgi:hypothetical protein